MRLHQQTHNNLQTACIMGGDRPSNSSPKPSSDLWISTVNSCGLSKRLDRLMEFILPNASQAASPSSTEFSESVSHSKSGELLSSLLKVELKWNLGLQASSGYFCVAELTSFSRSGKLIAMRRIKDNSFVQYTVSTTKDLSSLVLYD